MKKIAFTVLVCFLSVTGLVAEEKATTATENKGLEKAAEVNKGQKGQEMREQNQIKKEAKKEAKKAAHEAKKEAKKNRPE